MQLPSALPESDENSHKIRIMMERYGWNIMASDDLLALARTHAAQYPEYTFEQAIKASYMHRLFEACLGQHGQSQREAAYHELHTLLFQQACRRNFQPADDVCQQAITRIFERIETCRNPFAFWEFANQQLLSSLQDIRRKTRHEFSLEALTEDFAAPLILRDNETMAPTTVVLRQEQKALIIGYMQEFLRQHPRAHKQIAAVWLKFVTGLDDHSISQQLNTSIDHVYTLRNRAINKMRQDPRWQTIAQDFGILPD